MSKFEQSKNNECPSQTWACEQAAPDFPEQAAHHVGYKPPYMKSARAKLGTAPHAIAFSLCALLAACQPSGTGSEAEGPKAKTDRTLPEAGISEAPKTEATDGGQNEDPETRDRPPLLSILPSYFAFGYSYYWDSREWPPLAKKRGVDWTYMYWYQTIKADETVLPDRLAEAKANDVLPVLTHYQILDRAWAKGYKAKQEWDVITQAVVDKTLMREYFDDVQALMEEIGDHSGYLIFQTEPDTTTWLRQYHTGGTSDATQGHVAVSETGHPDLVDLPNTVSGYVRAIVRLRDLYAKNNVYIGLCLFDNENGHNPEASVKFLQTLGTRPDVLFTHHVVKYSNRKDGWWDDYSEQDQKRFLNWLRTITQATGLRYIHWQTTIGPADHGLMPDYPNEERISDLVAAGSIGNLIDVFKLKGPPHSQPWHGFSTSPPKGHPAYNSLNKLEERLKRYFDQPIPLPQ